MKHAPKSRGPKQPAWSHLDPQGKARMVNVSAKPVVLRRAIAEGRLVCHPKTILALKARALPKGDVLAVAQVAAIQAAKQTSHLIPLCHPLAIDHVEVRFDLTRDSVLVRCEVTATARTGAEMEALTAVSVAALTLYDMCKAVDRSMRIEGVRVLDKLKQ